jgi:predicted membrane GTPase involved in stress response
MTPALPLEQFVQLDAMRCQTGFADRVASEVAHLRRFAQLVTLEAGANGLLVRGENEESLERAVQALRELYRERLRALPPRVRYVTLDHQCLEPIMVIRVRVAERDLGAVHADLATRDVNVLEEDFRRGVSVVRAEVPLRRLLGYAARLAALTRGTGRHWCWLDRYAPLREPLGPAVG